jgi:hypothetical protein
MIKVAFDALPTSNTPGVIGVSEACATGSVESALGSMDSSKIFGAAKGAAAISGVTTEAG